MKFLSIVLLVISFDAFSDVQTIKLRDKDKVKVACPVQNTKLVVEGSTAKCVCPESAYGHYVGNTLVCESQCHIEVSVYEHELCDQGGCQPGTVTTRTLSLRKNDEYLSSESLVTGSDEEIEALLPELIDEAKQECVRTLFNGKLI